MRATTERAIKEGSLVITTADERTYNLEFRELGRGAPSDHKKAESHGEGCWRAFALLSGQQYYAPGGAAPR